jgi:GntR family transcriptional regulator
MQTTCPGDFGQCVGGRRPIAESLAASTGRRPQWSAAGRVRVALARSSMSQQPLYVQIKRWLVGQIETGQLAEGAMLSPEQELADRFGVSRPTVRQAILELAREGTVARARGRGTVVLGRRLEYPARRLVSFTEEYAAGGQRLTATVLQSAITAADQILADRLGIEPGSEVFNLGRLRCVNGEAVSWQRSYIPARYVPGIEAVDFSDRSLYGFLTEQYGFELAYGDEVIGIGRANHQEAELLAIQRTGEPVFRIERWSYLSPTRLLELVESVYRGDRYEIRLRLTR